MSDFNNLSSYDIMHFKSEGYDAIGNNKDPSRKNITIVAEGDSWFDYPPGIDIPDYLNGFFNYNVLKFGKYGDRLLSMIYGIDEKTKMKNLEYIKSIIVQSKTNIFLFSGGGNDIAGDQLEIFLEYFKDSKLKPADLVKKNILDDFMNYLKTAIVFMIEELLKINTKIKIVMHGYGYAVPDGRPVYYILGSVSFIGPWLKPALSHRGINNLQLGKDVIKIIIDSYNEVLKDIADNYNCFYYIDLRKIIKNGDWVNELHVNNEMFKKIAKIFHDKIQEILLII